LACWLTYSGWFTHINGYPSAAGPVQTSESSPVRDQSSTTEQPNQLYLYNTWNYQYCLTSSFCAGTARLHNMLFLFHHCATSLARVLSRPGCKSEILRMALCGSKNECDFCRLNKIYDRPIVQDYLCKSDLARK